MQLIKVYSNKKSFRDVKFNETGLNFIVAKQKNPEITEKGQTYNGVGKSLLVRIIHFCLGAGKKNYKEFNEKLPGWEFYLDFKIDKKYYTVKRSTNKANRIILNGEDISVNKFTGKMAEICFDIPNEISFLSFRSLIPFFIRPNRESYVSYDKPGKTFSHYQSLLYNTFLLGLNVFLVQEKQKIKKEKDRIKDLESNFKKDSLLRDFFTGNKDITLTLIDIEERIKKLDMNIKKFQVAEDYNDVQIKADKVERELFELNNKIIMLKNNIINIDKGLDISHDINKDDIKNIYDEANIHFSNEINKDLEELEAFYCKLISNRKRRLSEQKDSLSFDVQSKLNKSKSLQRELDKLMQYLGEHQALDIFLSLSNRISELKSERDNLKKYQELQSEYKNEERNADKNLMNLAEAAEEYLRSNESGISELRNYFRNLAKRFYPDSVAGLTIENNEGDNQMIFDIDAKIESDTSDGINNVKIFCYDLTILFKGSNHNIDFIFHDSRLFDGIDERQKTDIFRTVYDKFPNTTKQYIATINQNQLDEVSRQMTEEEFENIITNNTVLTLTDELDSQKLLGIKVDIEE